MCGLSIFVVDDDVCSHTQEILYAGRRIGNDDALETFNVPPGCQCLIAIEGEKLKLGKPDPGAYSHDNNTFVCFLSFDKIVCEFMPIKASLSVTVDLRRLGFLLFLLFLFESPWQRAHTHTHAHTHDRDRERKNDSHIFCSMPFYTYACLHVLCGWLSTTTAWTDGRRYFSDSEYWA